MIASSREELGGTDMAAPPKAAIAAILGLIAALWAGSARRDG